MEISKSISYITEDPRWQQKLLIGTGVIIASTVLSVVIIGIIGYIIFAGYCIRLLINVREGQMYPLPEWDQWGADLTRGFKLIIASIVWALPVIVLIIPYIIGGALVSGRNSDASQFIGTMLLICGNCLSFLYALLLTVVAPGISIAFATDQEITSGLQFREIIAWTQANIGQVIIVTLVVLVAGFALSLIGGIVGVLLCIVGLIVTVPLATLLTGLFQYHLYGQLALTYPYPVGSSGGRTGGIDPTLTAYTPSSVTPDVPPVEPLITPPATGTDTAVGDTTDYPDTGVDNPAPPPPSA